MAWKIETAKSKTNGRIYFSVDNEPVSTTCTHCEAELDAVDGYFCFGDRNEVADLIRALQDALDATEDIDILGNLPQ